MNSIEIYKNYRSFKKQWEKTSKTLKALKDTCDGFFKFSKVLKYTTIKDKREFESVANTFGVKLEKVNPDTLSLINHEKLVNFLKSEGLTEDVILTEKTYDDFRKQIPEHFEIKEYFNSKEMVKILENKVK